MEPVFYVPLFHVKPVFNVTLSRTKWIFFMVSKLYFTGTSHLREENLVPGGHVKYRFHCILQMMLVKMNQIEEIGVFLPEVNFFTLFSTKFTF